MTIRPITVAFAWYRPDQWEALRRVAEDRDELDPSYKQWLATAEKSILELALGGVQVQRIEIDVAELVAWCRNKGLVNVSGTRSQYASEMIRKMASLTGG